MKTRRYLFVAMSIVLLLGLSLPLACAKPAPAPAPAPAPKPAPAPVPWPKAISLTTPKVGTSLNVYGSAIAGLIEKSTKVVVTPQPCTGGLEAIQLFAAGEADMGAANAYDTQSTYFAREKYNKATDRVRFFAGAYSSVYHLLVRADSGISTAADLKGKRCMFLRPGSPPHNDPWIASLKAYGLTDKDIVLMPSLSPKESAQALKEGTADAAGLLSAPPNPVYLELDRTTPIRFLAIEPDKQAQILKDVPYMQLVTVKGGTYQGTPDDTPALAILAPISIARQLPDDFAYAAIKGVIENFADLQAAHASFKKWEPADLVETSPVVPFHPSVFKYFKDAGLMTPEAEKNHNELLKSMNQES